jgi:hypothetical protein
MLRKHGAGKHRINDFSAPDGGFGRRFFASIAGRQSDIWSAQARAIGES